MMQSKKYRRWIVLALGLGVLVTGGAWWLRSQQVVWATSDSQLSQLLKEGNPSLEPRSTAVGSFPWEVADLVFRRTDPWGLASAEPLVRPLTGAPPPEIVAFGLYGLLSRAQVPAPTDFATWVQDLDRPSSPSAPMAVAAKSDHELLSLLMWFGAGVLGPEKLQATFVELRQNPSQSVAASGLLHTDHPLNQIVEEIRKWDALGRFVPQWWDYSDADVVNAIVQGRARWGLTWSSLHASAVENGIALTSLHLVPTWPGQRSSSLIGQWLVLEPMPGWASSEKLVEARQILSSVSVSQAWLKKGWLLADSNLPAVNQEAKSLGIGFLSAGYLLSAPSPTSDLSQWHPLLEAVRAALRR